MAQVVLEIDHLPEGAIAAASRFHEDWMDEARNLLAGDIECLSIVMPPAPYDHADWRCACARDLARMFAPTRINVVGGGDPAAIEEALAYLSAAPGVTGQYLPLQPFSAEARYD